MRLSQCCTPAPAQVELQPRWAALVAWFVVWIAGVAGSGVAFAAVPTPPPQAYAADSGMNQFKAHPPSLAQRAMNKNQGTFLLISSSAVGAQVFINGVYVGEVNRRIRVMPGIRRLEVIHKDYVSRSIEVRILKGKTQQIRMDLEPKVSAAPGAAVAAGTATPGYGQQPAYPQGQANVQGSPASQQNFNQGRQGAPHMQQKPMTKRKKTRRPKRRRQPPATAVYKAPPTPPRTAGSYMLSLLPLGLPQMVQKKPGLGLLFFLAQAGGVGVFGYYKFYMLPAFETVSKQSIQNTEEAINKSSGAERKRLTQENQNYKQNSDQYKQALNIYSYLGLGGFGLAYLASVVEAMVVGPAKPKSPLENLLSADAWECGSCAMELSDPVSPRSSRWIRLMTDSEMYVELLRPHPVSQAPSLALNWTISL